MIILLFVFFIINFCIFEYIWLFNKHERNKIKYLNLNIFRTRFCKPLIFQTQIIWSNRIYSLKNLRSATFGSKDIVIRKSEFVAKTQFLYEDFLHSNKNDKSGGHQKNIFNLWVSPSYKKLLNKIYKKNR